MITGSVASPSFSHVELDQQEHNSEVRPCANGPFVGQVLVAAWPRRSTLTSTKNPVEPKGP